MPIDPERCAVVLLTVITRSNPDIKANKPSISLNLSNSGISIIFKLYFLLKSFIVLLKSPYCKLTNDKFFLFKIGNNSFNSTDLS